MSGDKPKCMKCGKEIEGNEETFLKVRWPKRKGITEAAIALANKALY
jgi:hypothetical protein